MFTYKKTQLSSPLNLFIAKERNEQPGIFSIYRKGDKHPMFKYDSIDNRMQCIGGLDKLSPEGLCDAAELCKAIFDQQ